MSLDFNTSKIKDQTVVRDKEGNLTGLAQTMIFMTMFVDLNGPTPKNIDEFFRRVQIYEHGIGAMRKKDGEELFLNKTEISYFFGLTTNVPDLSDARWNAKLKKILFEKVSQKVFRHNE